MAGFDPGCLIERLAPFEGAGRCWVALSGGMDSSALLAAAAEVRHSLPGELRAVHLDHGLHPSSRRWAEHCAAFCQARSIPIHTQGLQLRRTSGESLEALARQARYDAFRTLLGDGELLLTAHHQDDQAETLLLALLRGSGLRGLSAMPFERRLGRGRLVRPLLDYRRSELEQYATLMRLKWIEDPSNDETSLDRNFIRHEILPLIERRWPAAARTVARSAGHCAEASGLIDDVAVQMLPQLAGDYPGSLTISLLDQLERPLQKVVLRTWIEMQGLRAPHAAQLDRILDEVVVARGDADPLVAWPGCETRRYRDDLFCLRPLPRAPAPSGRIAWRLGSEPSELVLPVGLGALRWLPDGREGSSAVEAEVRFGQKGQACRPGGGTHRRSLKKLFQEIGVPAWIRPYVPMLFAEDRLIAVAGIAGCRTDDIDRRGQLAWTGGPCSGVVPQLGRAISIGPSS